MRRLLVEILTLRMLMVTAAKEMGSMQLEMGGRHILVM